MFGPFPAPAGCELTLIRHGETPDNRIGRWQGSRDIPLSEVGLAQAEALRTRLAEESFDALYTSDLSRARQTMDTVRPDQAVTVTETLREVRLGPFEGLTSAEIKASHPEAFQRRIESDDPADFTFALPGMESRVAFNQRAAEAVQACTSGHAGQRVLVICHGGVLRAFFAAAFGLPLPALKQLEIPNCAVNRFREDRGRWRLVVWGDVQHLDSYVNWAT